MRISVRIRYVVEKYLWSYSYEIIEQPLLQLSNAFMWKIDELPITRKVEDGSLAQSLVKAFGY